MNITISHYQHEHHHHHHHQTPRHGPNVNTITIIIIMTATNFSIAFELLDSLRLGREHAPRPRAIVAGNIWNGNIWELIYCKAKLEEKEGKE